MKPQRVLALTALLTAGVLAIASSRWFDPEPGVYEAVLSQSYLSEVAVASAPSTCDAKAENFKAFSPELVSAFQAANAPGAGFADVSRLRNHVAVANSRQLAALEAQGLSPWFVGVPQVPVVRFSRVGFAKHEPEALFCIRSSQGSALVQLRRVEGAWHVVALNDILVTSLLPHNYSFKRTAATVCGTIRRYAAAAA